MAGKLQQEIKRTKPFRLLGEETALSIVRTADALMLEVTDLLKPYVCRPRSTTCCAFCAGRALPVRSGF